jgi:hypothetical protein
MRFGDTVSRSIGYEKAADVGQRRRSYTIHVSTRSYSLSGRPMMGRRASGNHRSASPVTGTGSLCGFSLHSAGCGAWAIAMGLILGFGARPSPAARIDVADDGVVCID